MMWYINLIMLEIKMTWRVAYAWITPLLFFTIIICLFPFAIGPDGALLSKMAPGVIWIATLLSILLSIDRLFNQIAHEGTLDLLLLSPTSFTSLIIIKIFSYWILYCLPLIVMSPLLGYALNMTGEAIEAMVITLVLGTPILCLMGSIGASLVVGIRASGILIPTLIMPFYVPVLIFGIGTITEKSLHHAISGQLAILGALLLFSLALAPFFIHAALRGHVTRV